MSSIPGRAGDQPPGRRSRPALTSGWRESRRLPATGAPIAALLVLVATTTSPSCRSGSDGDPDQAPPASAGGPTAEVEPRAPAASAGDLTAEQRLRADRLINNFEHGTTEFLYG